jgi:hypothetical protein
VKIVAGIATALAVLCSPGLSARAAGAGASAAAVSSNIMVVTNTDDVVNGDASSVAALNRNPGRDGISLREALAAADQTGGSETVYIMFSAALNGKTIQVRSLLPPVHRNHLVIEGIAPNGAPAHVALNGRRLGHLFFGQIFLVQASEVTIRWLRFTGVDPTGPVAGQQAVYVTAGPIARSPGPRTVTNVRIEDNVFDNRGITIPSNNTAHGVLVSVTPGKMQANGRFGAITIARNEFLHYTPDSGGIGIWTNSPGSSATGVVIRDNSFDQDFYPIEISVGGNRAAQTGDQIMGNTITGGDIGISIETVGPHATIDHTLIEDNTISGTGTIALGLDAAPVPKQGKPGSNMLSNTQILNNVIRVNGARVNGIRLAGGGITSSPPTRLSAVTIENDTLVSDGPGSLFDAIPNGPGATGNQITGVVVRNSILYDPFGTPIVQGTTPLLQQPPDVVTNSLISGPGWAGANGNITGDPLFVSGALGDYQLTAASPAINAGTPIGAPSFDLNGARRDSPPDIGAFDFGAVPRPLLTLIAEPLGGSGTVTSSPAGINCETACSARFDPGATVTLTAKPDPGSRFLGWHHGCSGKARCTITLDSATTVIARFGP